MKKKTLCMLMGMTLGFTAIFGAAVPMGVTVSAAEDGVTDAECTDKNTTAPAPDDVVPDANQFRYQKDELAAFCHFGPNTFNEVEWGERYGDRLPADIFTLTNDFDAETLVKTLKNAGFKKLIVTAKHHDGFCIWASDYTTYDIASTNYKGGEGDVLAEISAACTEYDLDMGLYLSPWDIHEPSYGYYDKDGNATTKENDVLDYNEYYNNQLTEILSNEKYGNHGHFVEVWMDGAKGSGANAQEYDFTTWFNTIQKYEGIEAGYDADCMLFGAGAYTTVRWIGNENGLAYEDTWSKSKANSSNNTIDNNTSGQYTKGFEDGNKWTVPECDGRITSGWFWGTQKCTPKTISDLANMYFDSVGHNSTMLLNVPPNNQGTIDTAIVKRVEEFGENIEETFRSNLAASAQATITATNVRGSDTAFKPGNTVDGKDETYWTTDDGTNSGSLTVKWNSAKSFDVVSVEEAIQNGQRINSYKVEYKANDNAQWQTLKSGTTVGAKRLVRTAPVSATQVRITVGTSEGKVPMISGIGIYKASKGFQLGGAAPDGMETTSVNDSAFTFSSSGWNPQTGSQYINGQNTYSSAANASFEFSFTGTKIYLLGTKDPGHGQADIYIDGKLVQTINTQADSRSTGTKIFESEDLTDENHTLKLVTKSASAAIGVEAASVINNGGVGMVELEKSAYSMGEDAELTVKLKRVGGTNGDITVRIQPNPGSAIQDDFNTELNPLVTLKDGVSEVTVTAAKTRRNTNKTGDRVFSIELAEISPENAIIGFNNSAKITIADTEMMTSEQLSTLAETCSAVEKHLYTSGWTAFEEALEEANLVLENEEATAEMIAQAYLKLNDAKENLVLREKFTTEDPVVFPWKSGSSTTVEAEFATELTNSSDSDSNPSWPMSIGNGTGWASNGKFVNAMAYKDYLRYAYYAEKPGVYTVTGSYRSGALNKISFSEESGKIESTEASCPRTNASGSLTVATFTVDLVVKEAGAGTLVLTAPSGYEGPQLDKLVITPKQVEVNSYTVTVEDAEHGTITAEGLANHTLTVEEGDDAVFTIMPEQGYEVADVLVDGESVGICTEYRLKNVKANHVITARFAKTALTEAKEALQSAINTAEQKLQQTEGYTAASVQKLRDAVAAAKAALQAEDATADSLTEARTALEAVELETEHIYIVTVDGVETARGQYGQWITLKAEEKEGKVFAGWAKGGKVVSTSAAYRFALAGDTALTTVYDEEVSVEASADMSNAFTLSKQNGRAKVRFVGQIVVPEGYKLEECGMLWTGKSITTVPVMYTSDGTNLNVVSPAKKVVAANWSSTYQYSVTISNVPIGKTARGVIYAKVTKGAETKYVFSNESAVTAQ